MGQAAKRRAMRARFAHEIKVKHQKQAMGQAIGIINDTSALARAARYAAHWYRRRWLWTLAALDLVALAVAIYVVV